MSEPNASIECTGTRRELRRADTLVYEEKDERFNVNVGKSRSKGYIFLVSAIVYDQREARYVPAPTRRRLNGK